MRAGFGAWNPPSYLFLITDIDVSFSGSLSPSSSASIPNSVFTDSECSALKMVSIDAAFCQEFCNTCCYMWAEFGVPLPSKNSRQPPFP